MTAPERILVTGDMQRAVLQFRFSEHHGGSVHVDDTGDITWTTVWARAPHASPEETVHVLSVLLPAALLPAVIEDARRAILDAREEAAEHAAEEAREAALDPHAGLP